MDESILVVPLRSNAHTLVAGAPILAMRRRLKWASIFFDRVYLEGGVFHAQAGPSGSVSFVSGPTPDNPARWQTAGERHAGLQTSFHLALGAEGAPGVPAETMHTVIASDTSISWKATLHPFAAELPTGCDWVEFVTSVDPTGDAEQLVKQWTWADERNDALEQAIPDRFVRSTVIKHANRDLALVATAGVTASVDALHLRVVEQRFRDDTNWRFRGFAVPILFPSVADLPWEDIARLRRDPQMSRFRAVLGEVEEEAMLEAISGDIEAAAHHAYENHLVGAVGSIEGVGAAFRNTTLDFVIGAAAGIATTGITGPIGIAGGAALGAATGAAFDVRKIIRRRRSSSWVSVHQLLANSSAEAC